MTPMPKDKIKYEWFMRGRKSVLRENKSGCCCIIDDNDNIIEACGAHQEWMESAFINEIKEIKC